MPRLDEVLHAALRAQPQQTAQELAQVLAGPLTAAEVEGLLHRDPRLRHDGGDPLRWRALGAGALLRVPTPNHPAAPVPTPASAFFGGAHRRCRCRCAWRPTPSHPR